MTVGQKSKKLSAVMGEEWVSWLFKKKLGFVVGYGYYRFRL